MLPAIQPYAVAPDVGLSDNVTGWLLESRRATVLVHDMQRHFVAAFDRDPSAQIDLAVQRIRSIVFAARRAGVPVVYTAQPPQQDPSDRGLLTDFWGSGLRDDAGASIIPELTPAAGETVLTKWRYSAFYRSDLRERTLDAGRDQIVLTGVYAHIGCLATALVAFMEGVQTFFVADAMADFSAADHAMAARYVGSRCGQVVTWRDVVADLSRSRPDRPNLDRPNLDRPNPERPDQDRPAAYAATSERIER